jgi:diguanylate cyclase (GGDEF)-like protein
MKHIRSLISSPIVHEGKAVGTLRLHSDQPSAFATDDLRILDAISTLASSAASNALLFYKTEELAIRDSVTGLYVQRYFRERLLEEHRRSLLTNAPLTLLMCDLDRFKSYNDRYGHAVGDLILKKSATLIKKTAKDGFVARYGGEEFAVLAPKHDLEAGHKLAETVREAIASMELSVRREVIPLTISIGVAAFPLDTLDSEELIHIADKRLYRAKEAGRNQVCSGE